MLVYSYSQTHRNNFCVRSKKKKVERRDIEMSQIYAGKNNSPNKLKLLCIDLKI